MLSKPIVAFLGVTLAGTAPGGVVSYECNSFPEKEGWGRSTDCLPQRWLDSGRYVQHVRPWVCNPPPGGDRESFTIFTGKFAGEQRFFIEWKVTTDGDRSEIPGVAPALLTANSFDVHYHIVIARDRIRFVYDIFELPLYVDVEPDVYHVYRLEFFGAELFVFYIDGEVVKARKPTGHYTLDDARIAWRAKSWYLESRTEWDFIRYGRIPEDASGDYDSDETLDLFDYYFAHECFSLSGPDVDAGPGCRFADFDGDADTDLRDFAAFQNRFTGDGG